MTYDITKADMQQMTAHWIEWGSQHMEAVRALLQGKAAVLPLAAIVNFGPQRENCELREVQYYPKESAGSGYYPLPLAEVRMDNPSREPGGSNG